MKTYSEENKSFLFWVSPLILVIAGLVNYLRPEVPVGPVFNANLYFIIVGTILALAVPGIKLLTSPERPKKILGLILSLAAYAALAAVVIVSLNHTLNS